MFRAAGSGSAPAQRRVVHQQPAKQPRSVSTDNHPRFCFPTSFSLAFPANPGNRNLPRTLASKICGTSATHGGPNLLRITPLFQVVSPPQEFPFFQLFTLFPFSLIRYPALDRFFAIGPHAVSTANRSSLLNFFHFRVSAVEHSSTVLENCIKKLDGSFVFESITFLDNYRAVSKLISKSFGNAFAVL